ncbi:MAG: hypothetical protein Aurels2KO_13210 [Aureliella sp.]
MIEVIKQVVAFEAIRSVTRSRLLVWFAIAALPTVLMVMLQSQARGRLPDEVVIEIAFRLVVQTGCMMGLLLWATPAVGSEVESQTWIYVAMRPAGRIAMVFGKYLVAVGWTILAGIPSSIGIAFASRVGDPLALAISLIGLVALASFSFAALYVLIGVAFSRRATVFAVVYSLLVEGAVARIPAAVCNITVTYRLSSLLEHWLGIELPSTAHMQLYVSPSPWQHIPTLAVYVIVLLTLAAAIIHRKEFATEATSA